MRIDLEFEADTVWKPELKQGVGRSYDKPGGRGRLSLSLGLIVPVYRLREQGVFVTNPMSAMLLQSGTKSSSSSRNSSAVSR